MDDNTGYDEGVSTGYGDWYCLCGPEGMLRIWGGILWWMYR